MIATTHGMRIADLWALQEIDSALDSRRGSLDDARASLEPPEEIEITRALSDETAQALGAARSVQKDLEVEADDLRAKIGAVDAKLYGGTVRNPKELSDLQADVESLKRHLGEIEDRGEALHDRGMVESENRALQEDVLHPSEIRLETRAELEQCRHAATHFDSPGGGIG